MDDEQRMIDRIAKAETEAEVQGYKMVPYPGEVKRWRLTKTVDDNWFELGPFDIYQLESELFGDELLKSEPRGNDGSLERPLPPK